MSQLFVSILYIIGTFIFYSLIYTVSVVEISCLQRRWITQIIQPCLQKPEEQEEQPQKPLQLLSGLYVLVAAELGLSVRNPVSLSAGLNRQKCLLPQRHPRCFYTHGENEDSNDAHQRSLVGTQG